MVDTDKSNSFMDIRFTIIQRLKTFLFCLRFYFRNIGNKKLLLVFVSDQNYLDHLTIALQSLSQNSPSNRAVISLVNVNQELVGFLKARFPKYHFATFYFNFDNASQQKAFSANFRVPFISELLKFSLSPILYLDADSIIRKKLPMPEQVLGSSKMAFIDRREGETKEKWKFATGVFALDCSRLSKRLVGRWKEILYELGNVWYADQIGLYRAVSEFDELQIQAIGSELADWNFNENSLIWTAKGDRKDLEKYNEEAAKYDVGKTTFKL